MIRPLIAVPLLLIALATSATAQIATSQANTPYAQNFDSLPASGTGSPAAAAWSNNSTIPGWYLHAGPNLAADISGIRITAGSSSSRSQTSYGTGTNTDRALGTQGGSTHDLSTSYSVASSIPESSIFGTISVAFSNTDTQPFTGFSFSYSGEQWLRSSTTTPADRDRLTVQWALGSISTAPSALTWTQFTAAELNPSGVTFNGTQRGTSTVAIDGNAAANRVTNLGATVANITWNPGQVLFIRWVDINDSSSDAGLAVDDFTFTANRSANVLPTVTLTTPAEAATFEAPTNLQLTASAEDTDGTIAKVEFFHDITKVGEDTAAPYDFTWAINLSGAYALTARATDSSGGVSESTPVNITVTNTDNMAPVAALTAPANGAVLEAGNITLTANASDVDGVISKVEFFQGATKLGEDSTAPFAFTWTGVTPADYALTAVANDNDGSAVTSSPVNITVVPVGSFISSYTQDFNGMGTAGTAPPLGWSVWTGPGTSNVLWTAATGIVGGPSSTLDTVGQMTLSTAALTVSSAPAANANNGYNAGAPGNSANRMLGSAPTSVGGMAFQLELTNSSGGAISSIRVAYDIQRFTAPSTVNDLPGYWLFYSVDNGANWINVSALNPVVSGGSVNVPNSTGVTQVTSTTVNLNSPWAANGTLRLRWVDDNAAATSPDQIFGLDNVSIVIPQPAPTVAITAPNSGATFMLPSPINLTAMAADANGTVTKVEFFAGNVKLGEDIEAPYEFSWSGMISGSYSLTAVATDNEGASAISAPVAITVTNPSNAAPSVALTSPLNGALVPALSFTLTAAASDTDGMVSKVEFFNGSTKLGEDNSAPFSFNWVGVPVGEHTLSAVATDNDGAMTTSSSIVVTATAFTDVTTISRGSVWKYLDDGSDQGVAWSAVGFDDSAWASGPAKLGYEDSAVTVLRQGPSGAVSSVKFITYYFRKSFTVADASQILGLKINLLRDDAAVVYLNGVEVARSNLPSGPIDYLTNSSTIVSNADETTFFPFDLSKASLVSGNNVIAVELHQRDNASSDLGFDMDLITTLAGGNALPVVQVTSPANGATFFPGNSVTITANANDSDGSVAKVEFFQGSTKLGEDAVAPYEFVWNNVTAGTYALTAVATDDIGSVGTSAAVNITVTPGPSGTLTRGPYLNQNNENSIVVRWRSSQSVVGAVRYGDSPTALTSITSEAATATDHVVRLTGLTPNTRYYYSVGSASDTLAGGDLEHTFRTSPTPGTATDTRIWVVGDCGRGSTFQREVRDAYYTWTGSRVPDLCLMLGDNAYNSGTDTEYQTGFYNIYPTYFRKMPVWSTLGNHDANNGSTSTTANFPYFDMFTFPTNGECGGVPSGTERYHSFDYGNVHVINLDSQASSRNTIEQNGADGPMAAWLRQDLAATTKTWILAIFHHPPYSKGSHDSDTESQMVQMRTHFGPIMENGGVDLVLVGHSHAYERSMLIDSHYGVSSTLTNAMKKNAGSGRPSGTGAYIKPLTGPRDHFGTVYTVTGSAGSADGGALNHPVMYVSYNTGGTLNVDINGNRLDATYVQRVAGSNTSFTTPDSFTILKQGAADSDADGIPDEWEIANGLNRLSAADAPQAGNGNTLTNLEKYLLGIGTGGFANYDWQTSPPDAVTGRVTVTFPTLAGRSYRVRYSDDLVIWRDASTEITGDGTTKQWVDDGTVTNTLPQVSGKRFYLVKVTLQP